MSRAQGHFRPLTLAWASLGTLLIVGGARAEAPGAAAAFPQLAENLFDFPKALGRGGGKNLPLKARAGGGDRPQAWSRLRKWLDGRGGAASGDRVRPRTDWPWGPRKGGGQAEHGPGPAPWWRGYGYAGAQEDPWQHVRPWYDAQRYATYPSYYGPYRPYPAYGGYGSYGPYPYPYYQDPYDRYDDDNEEIVGWLAFTAIAWKLLDNLNADQQRQHEMAMMRAENAPLGQASYWRSGSAGGSVTPTRQSAGASGPCRDFRHEIDVEGRKEVAYETACQLPDGSWEIVR